MTPSQREKAFRAARASVLKFRTQIQRATATEITSLLKEAQANIRAILASAPSDYQRWALPELQKSIAQALDEFERRASSQIASAAGTSWDAGQRLVTAPIEAGGVRIAAMLPEIDTRQLTAMRSFMTSRIKNISSTVAGRINAQLGLVIIGAQGPSDAIASVAGLIEGGRGRAITIVRTELGRAFSVAANDRLSEAAERLPGLKRQWRRSGKIHSRLHHDSIDGQIRAADEPFTLGNGVQIMFPRDPAAPVAETINCGCEAIPYMESWEVSTPDRRPYSEEEQARSPTKRALAAAGHDRAA